MGCIESRSLPNEEDYKILSYNRHKQFSIISREVSDEIKDARAHDIETYSNNLIYNSNWSTYIETTGYSVKIKQGSVFNSNMPVTLAFIDFDELITSDFIIEMLFDIETRKKWDDTVLEFEKISKQSSTISIYRVVKKFPFMPREFIFKACISHATKECSVALYSIKSHLVQENNLFERSEIMFCFIKVLERNSHTAILILQQIDNKLKLKPELLNLAAAEVNQWILLFKAQLIHSYHKN